MDESNELEEKFREAASIGDQDALEQLLHRGVNVNAQHRINGWTALHWASKRGHPTIVRYLLTRGADRSLTNGKGETAAQLTDREEIRSLLGGRPGRSQNPSQLPITPNFIQHPPFPYSSERNRRVERPVAHMNHNQQIANQMVQDPSEELVLKVRVANAMDTDFIEIEIDRNERTFSNLILTCCRELNCEPEMVVKLRKLPNTIIRKDKDVRRLTDFQELELVLQKLPSGTRLQNAFQELVY